MSRSDPRPVRNLAAWGYESDASGDRVEVDVWTVNARAGDDLPDPSAFSGPVDEVLAVASNVAKVAYAGAASTGYQYVDVSETNPGITEQTEATQNSFAGAARAAGGERTGDGTFGLGAEPAVIGPSLADVIEYGEREILPVVRRELREMGRSLVREPSRDEDDEQVTRRPFDGFKNEIRIVLGRPGDPTGVYTVRNGSLITEMTPYE